MANRARNATAKNRNGDMTLKEATVMTLKKVLLCISKKEQ